MYDTIMLDGGLDKILAAMLSKHNFNPTLIR